MLETYENKLVLQCIECEEIYNGEHCPECGSTFARVWTDEDEPKELIF